MCREGYFGPDCGCSPRDDSTGHFTCDTNGIKVCLPGYQNPQTNCVEEPTTEPLTTNNQADTETTDTDTEAATTDTNTEAATTHTNTEAATRSTTTEPPSSTNNTASLPIAVGGTVGGLVLITHLIVAIIVIAFVCKSKNSKEENVGKLAKRILASILTVLNTTTSSYSYLITLTPNTILINICHALHGNHTYDLPSRILIPLTDNYNNYRHTHRLCTHRYP